MSISKLTLQVDKEFLEGYRSYKFGNLLDDEIKDNLHYRALEEFLNTSTYNLNRLFEEVNETDGGTIDLMLDDLSVVQNHNYDGFVDGEMDFDALLGTL